MASRQPYWCVAEISEDGKISPLSPAFEDVADAEERKGKLLEKEEHQGKNLQVIKASHPVDPRKPPRRRRLGSMGYF
ncbi:MAG: hypothetical protein LAN18_07660 [Acidobacteriia bacterium]|nr:hypothetical protein [Terriglobia bacterium]